MPILIRASIRARFIRFEEYALEIQALAYILTTEYNYYLHIAEELNLAIMDVVQNVGAVFSTPMEQIGNRKVT